MALVALISRTSHAPSLPPESPLGAALQAYTAQGDEIRLLSHYRDAQEVQDIAEYVKFVVRPDPKMRAWREKDKELVVLKYLRRKLTGSIPSVVILGSHLQLQCRFRWVTCQLEYLRRCLRQHPTCSMNYWRRSTRHTIARWKTLNNPMCCSSFPSTSHRVARRVSRVRSQL